MSRERGSGLLEFALVWPLVLLAVLAAVQIGIWSAAGFAARSAALAGARAGATAGGSSGAALAVARPVLTAAMPATPVSSWCPPGVAPPGVWVCARDTSGGFEVLVGGRLAALLPLLPGRDGVPVRADAVLPYERFQ